MTRTEILSTAKPILFNTNMVMAIHGGRKTATRRPCHIKINGNITVDHKLCCTAEYPETNIDGLCVNFYDNEHFYKGCAKPPYKIGDILYVRETWTELETVYGVPYYAYKADDHILHHSAGENFKKWRPSIHMPKKAARTFLRVTGVRVERLQDIITEDYKTPLNINKEGLTLSCCFCTHHNGDCKDYISQHTSKTLTCKLLEDFTLLWNSTVKKSDLDKYGWKANPWVWVIEFERVEVE